MITAIVTGYEDNFSLLPYCLNGLMQQIVPCELIIVFKCADPLHTRRAVERFTKALPNAKLLFTCPNDLHGNPERRLGLTHATGDYVTWLSCDNVPYPWWIETHQENIDRQPGCISIINTIYWSRDELLGGMPSDVTRFGGVDLLNYALPRDVALRIDAFGKTAGTEFASDYPVLQEAMKHAPIYWDKTQLVAAAHF